MVTIKILNQKIKDFSAKNIKITNIKKFEQLFKHDI